jgi:uroporphyrinogen-III decarboxylase
MKMSMTGRERVVAALHGQPVDRLPWIPFINPYTMAGLPLSIPQYLPDALEFFGCDIFARVCKVVDVKVTFQDHSDITPIYCFDHGDRITGYQTPLGELTSRERSMGPGRMPMYVEHLIKNGSDLQTYRYILENSFYTYILCTDEFEYEDRAIGERGILSIGTAAMSPIQEFLQKIVGVENTIYLIADYPQLIEEVFFLMQTHHKRVIEIQAQSPATVFITYENTGYTTLSPVMYDRYCRSYLDDYTTILHRYNKLHLIHACGKLTKLKKQISESNFDGLMDIAPGPTGDIELWEARETFGKVVSGGIDCTTFALATPDECYNRMIEVIEKVKPLRGILIGSGDSTPCGTTIENLKAMQRAIEVEGYY